MLYLLDANVLINAHRTYYGIDMVPEFWDWIYYNAQIGRVKMPSEILNELIDGPDDPAKDPLYGWLKSGDIEDTLRLSETLSVDAIQTVLKHGYGGNLNDIQIEGLGQDPFLVAYSHSQNNRCIVTAETSKPSRSPHNRKVPDACNLMKFKWCDQHAFTRQLGFKTNWRQAV